MKGDTLIMKKIFLISLPLLLVSLFIFPVNVKADTIENLSDSMISASNNITASVLSDIDTYLSTSYPTYKDNYIIIYDSNNNSYQLYAYSNASWLVISPVNNTDYWNIPKRVRLYCSMNSSTLAINSCNINNYAVTITNTFFPLYSSISLNLTNYNDETYVFTNGDNSYSLVFSQGNTFPTVIDLVDYWNSTPPDNYPILTSFITTVLEKISLTCEYFSSNYIFLTIFVIFIFYFVILLFRRLK